MCRLIAVCLASVPSLLPDEFLPLPECDRLVDFAWSTDHSDVNNSIEKIITIERTNTELLWLQYMTDVVRQRCTTVSFVWQLGTSIGTSYIPGLAPKELTHGFREMTPEGTSGYAAAHQKDLTREGKEPNPGPSVSFNELFTDGILTILSFLPLGDLNSVCHSSHRLQQLVQSNRMKSGLTFEPTKSSLAIIVNCTGSTPLTRRVTRFLSSDDVEFPLLSLPHLSIVFPQLTELGISKMVASDAEIREYQSTDVKINFPRSLETVSFGPDELDIDGDRIFRGLNECHSITSLTYHGLLTGHVPFTSLLSLPLRKLYLYEIPCRTMKSDDFLDLLRSIQSTIEEVNMLSSSFRPEDFGIYMPNLRVFNIEMSLVRSGDLQIVLSTAPNMTKFLPSAFFLPDLPLLRSFTKLTELDIPGELEGDIPTEIFWSTLNGCYKLEKLSLGWIPPIIANDPPLFSQPIMRRIRTLNLDRLEPPLPSEFLSLLAECHQLESLELYHAIDVSLPEVVSFLRPISILPNLRHLVANGQYGDTFQWITWELGKPVDCEVQELAHGFREVTREGTITTSAQASQKDLTREGIESNPGPNASFSELFTDGILSIFSYLRLGELNFLGQTNRTFQDLIHSGRVKSTFLYRATESMMMLIPYTPPEYSIRYLVSQFIPIGDFPIGLLKRMLTTFPRLTELNLSSAILYGSTLEQIRIIVFAFPHSLRSVHLELSTMEINVAAIFRGLGKCRSLTTLIYSGRLEVSPLFTPIYGLPLIHLEVKPIFSSKLPPHQHGIDLLKSLENTIEIVSLSWLAVRPNELSGISFPQLKQCDCGLTLLKDGDLDHLLLLVPNIESLTRLWLYLPDLPRISEIPMLTELQVTGDITWDQFWTTLDECKKLRSLRLGWLPEPIPIEPYGIFSRPIMRRITILQLQNLHFRLPCALLSDLVQCEQLEDLALHHAFDCDFTMLVSTFRSLTILPHLRSIDLLGSMDARMYIQPQLKWKIGQLKAMSSRSDMAIGFREVTPMVGLDITASDPPKDLTREGIEPNPGPFVELFNDGILTIFSFLKLSELNSIGETCQQFLSLVQSDRVYGNFTFDAHDSTLGSLPASSHLCRHVSRFFKYSMKSVLAPVPLSIINRVSVVFPRLHELHIGSKLTSRHQQPEVPVDAPEFVYEFPRRLTTIVLTLYPPDNPKSIFLGIGECRSLTSLIYTGPMGGRSTFTPIFSLPLVRLELRSNASPSPLPEHGLELLKSISQTIELVAMTWLNMELDHLVDIYFPRIKRFDVGFSIRVAGDLEKLFFVTPNRETLSLLTWYTQDFQCLNKFLRLTELYISEPTYGDIFYDTFWSTLDSCVSLLTLTFGWLPRLNGQPMIDFSRSCMRRVTTLRLLHLRLPSLLLSGLFDCHQMKSVTLGNAFDLSLEELVSKFRSITILPRLTFLFIAAKPSGPGWYSQIQEFQWINEGGMPKCDVNEMTQGFRRKISTEVYNTETPKDLTREGIEPNPGPTAGSLLSELFTDGILSIFSFLALSDLHTICQLSCHFSSLIRSDRLKSAHAISDSSILCEGIYTPIESGLSSGTLHRFITSIHMDGELVPIEEFGKILSAFPRLRTLTILFTYDTESDPDDTIDADEIESSDDLSDEELSHSVSHTTPTLELPDQWPPIQSLTITLLDDSCIFSQLILDSLSHISNSLIHLQLDGFLPEVDFSKFSESEPKLISLQIRPHDNHPPIPFSILLDLLNSACSETLEDVRLVGTSAQISADDMSLMYLPQCTMFWDEINCSEPGMLPAVVEALPNIKELSSERFVRSDFPTIAKFQNLQVLTIHNEIFEVSYDLFWSTLDECMNLIYLQLKWLPPNPYNSITPFSRPIFHRIQTLRLTNHTFVSRELIELGESASIHTLMLELPSLELRDIITAFHSPTTLPNLRSISLLGSAIVNGAKSFHSFRWMKGATWSPIVDGWETSDQLEATFRQTKETSDPSASFSALFTDGIFSILSFLTLSELNSTVHASARFLELIQSDRLNCGFSFHPTEASISIIPIASNSLTRMVTRLVISSEIEFPLDSLPRVLAIFPRLTELSIGSILESDEDLHAYQSDDAVISFPPSLRSLTFNPGEVKINSPTIFRSLTECYQLTCINYFGYLTGDTPLTPIFHLPLRHLELDEISDTESIKCRKHFIHLISAIQNTIEYIRIPSISILPVDLNGIHMPNIRWFGINISFEKSGDLQLFLSAAPNITTLSPEKLYLPDLPPLRSSSSLTELHIPSGVQGDLSSETFWSTLDECLSLCILRLGWIPPIADNDPPLFSRPIMRRVTTLDLHLRPSRLPSKLLPLLSGCHQMVHLSLLLAFDAHLPEIVDTFRSLSVMPSLHSFHVIATNGPLSSTGLFRWNCDACTPVWSSMNESLTKGFREHKFITHNDIRNTEIHDSDAPKDLTREGVEPNPGPSTSGSIIDPLLILAGAAATDTQSPPIHRLYTDCIVHVLSFMSLQDSSSAVRSNHAWYGGSLAALRSRCVEFKSQRTYLDLSTIAASHLARHVDSLVLPKQLDASISMRDIFNTFPNLTNLRVSTTDRQWNNLTLAQCKLTTLHVTFDDAWQVNDAIRTIGTSTGLITLTLETITRAADLTPLHSLVALETLVIQLAESGQILPENMKRWGRNLTGMPASLRSLSVNGVPGGGSINFDFLLPQLESFNKSCVYGTDSRSREFIQLYAEAMPGLRILDADSQDDLHHLVLLPHLTDLEISAGFHGFHPDYWKCIGACSNLERLHLLERIPDGSHTQLGEVMVQLPRLTELDLSAKLESIEFLAAPALSHRLRSLTLLLTYLPSSAVDHLLECRSLTSLNLYHFAFKDMKFLDITKPFSSPSSLPLLRTFACVVEWYGEERFEWQYGIDPLTPMLNGNAIHPDHPLARFRFPTALPLNSPPISVPSSYIGLWRRHVIRRSNGVEDRTTRVLWFQGESYHIDLRVPSGASFNLVDQLAFAGTTVVSGSRCEWRPEIAFPFVSDEIDSGEMRFDGDRYLFEVGSDSSYEEEWERIDSGPVSQSRIELPSGVVLYELKSNNYLAFAEGRPSDRYPESEKCTVIGFAAPEENGKSWKIFDCTNPARTGEIVRSDCADEGPLAMATAVSFSAQSMFTDGLHSVYRFLSLADLLPAVHSCRSWYMACKREPSRGFILQRCTADRLALAMTSPLRFHIGALQYSQPGLELPVALMLEAIQQFSHLTSVRCFIIDYTIGLTPPPVDRTHNTRLRSLQLRFTKCDARVQQGLLLHVAAFTNLTRLELTSLHGVSLTPIFGHPSISTLTIEWRDMNTFLIPSTIFGELDVLRSLPSLTSLDMNRGHRCLEWLHQVRLPNILQFSLSHFIAEDASESLLEVLIQSTPNLTSFDVVNISVPGLRMIGGLKSLRSITFHSKPHSHSNKESAVIRALTLAPSLTELRFENGWTFEHAELWKRLFQSNLNRELHRLVFIGVNLDGEHAGGLSLSTIAAADQLGQITSIHIERGQMKLSDLNRIGEFGSCQELVLGPRAFDQSVYSQRVMDVLSNAKFLPRLESLRVIGRSIFEWKVGDRGLFRQICIEEVSAPDPPKDLTREGIEPNPGPTGSFVELFTDGILTILYYLTLSELNSIGHTSRRFHELIQSDRVKGELTFVPNSTNLSWILMLPTALSLSVTRLISPHEFEFPYESLRPVLAFFPRLMELHIESMLEPLQAGETIPSVITFPHGLRTVLLPGGTEIHSDIIFRGLSACHELTSLTYIGPISDGSPLTPLFSLPLRELSIDGFRCPVVSVNHFRELLISIRSTIEYLTMQPGIHLVHLDGIVLPQMRRFDIDISFEQSGELQFFLSVAPNLTTFHPYTLFLPDLPLLSSFRSLTELSIGGVNGQISHDSFWSTLDECLTVRTLRLTWIPPTTPVDSKFFTRPIMRRITKLILSRIFPRLPKELLPLLTKCDQLEDLTLTYAFDCHICEIVETFRSINVLPHLRTFVAHSTLDDQPKQPRAYFHWDIDDECITSSIPELMKEFRQVKSNTSQQVAGAATPKGSNT